MIYRTLGRTGERVSAIGVGGWHLSLKHVSEELSIRIVREAIDRGINFMDNCWDYNEGESEIRMGKALRDGYREQGLPDDQDRRALQEGGRAAARESLRRLQTDRIDLVQHHEIIRYEDPASDLRRGGRQRRAGRGAQGGQAPLHRLHRAQGSARSICTCWTSRTEHGFSSTRCRCR